MPRTTTAVILFGRFQPPTKGHERLFKLAVEKARRMQGAVYLFPSQTQDRRNPLSYEQKLALVKPSMRSYPEFQIGPKTVKSPYDALTWAGESGFTSVLMLVGSDRMEEFRRLSSRWQQQEDPSKTLKIRIESIPRTGAMDASKVSGTVARSYAQHGDLASFQDVLISDVPLRLAQSTMKTIQQQLGTIHEWNLSMDIIFEFSDAATLTEEEERDVNRALSYFFEMAQDEEDEVEEDDVATDDTEDRESPIEIEFQTEDDEDDEDDDIRGAMHAAFELDGDEYAVPSSDDSAAETSAIDITFNEDDEDEDADIRGAMHAVFELDETDEDPAIKDETLGAVNPKKIPGEPSPTRYPMPNITVEKEPPAANAGGRVESDNPNNQSVVVLNPKRHLRHDLAVKALERKKTASK